jgi:hypothetical protein
MAIKERSNPYSLHRGNANKPVFESAQQEPVAKDNSNYRLDPSGLDPLYTSSPAQRTWVGLTNNELQPIADEYRILFGSWVEDFARAIEAKLKEKNCGV